MTAALTFFSQQVLRNLGGLLVLALALAAGPTAFGQWGIFQLAEKPPVTSRAPELMERVVGLNAEQASMVEAMQEEALADFERIAEIMESIQEDAEAEGQETDDRMIWVDLFAKAYEFVEAREAIRQEFLSNAELLVRPEQQERWEHFERRFTRQMLYDESITQYGSVAGVTVDIEDVVEATDIDEQGMPSEIQAMLVEYGRELERELVGLKEAADENARARIEAFRKMREEGGGWDMEMMSRGLDQVSERIESVRSINTRFERRIATVLEPELRLEFQRAYNKAAFPEIYRSTPAESRFERVLGSENLTDEQRATVSDLREQYLREADAVRSTLREIALEQNPIERFQMGWWRDNENEDEEEAKERLDELSQRYVDQVNATLTPEQREELGDRDPSDWRNRRFDV